jgi:hypothetical protein
MRQSLQPTVRMGQGHEHEPMKILSLLHLTVARAFYAWALREINPLHPDMPRIVLRRQELERKAQRMWA